jgi:hypothetical protein
MSYFRNALLKESPISNSFNRIGLALSYIVFYWRAFGSFNKETYLGNVSTYDPKGILVFFENKINFFYDNWDLFYALHFIALMFFLFGFLTHYSSFILLFVKLIFVGLLESVNQQGYWCHGANIVLLAHIAFLFASPGKYSMDYYIVNKYPKLKNFLYPFKDLNWHNWLAALAIALMFFNAFSWKIYNSGFAWAFSDNMRNILILQYTMAQNIDIPWYILKILESEILYKGLAAINLFIQGITIFSIIFYNRPFLRAFFGSFFVLEVLGLLYIVSLWNLDWIFLYVFFIDWEYFIYKLKNNKANYIQLSNVSKCTNIIFSLLFITVYLVSAFSFHKGPSYCYKLNLYPFSSYPMYSYNVAKKPYNIHKSFERPGLKFEFYGFKSLEINYSQEYAENELLYKFSEKYRDYHLKEQKEIVLKEIINFLKTRKASYDSLYVYHGFYTVAPYPGSPYPTMKHKGLYGKIFNDDNIEYISIHRYLNNESRFYLDIKSNDTTLQKENIKIAIVYQMQVPIKGIKTELKNDTLYYLIPKLNGYYSFMIYKNDSLQKIDKPEIRYHSEIFGHYWGDGRNIEL